MTSLLWLRDDLRVTDHPALRAACEPGHPVVALWIHETLTRDEDGELLGPRPLGGAVRWWYHRSLERLAQRLAELGIPLVLARGDALQVLQQVTDALQPDAVHWTRRYAPAARRLDALVKQRLAGAVPVHSHPGNLLVEPWLVQPASGTHYRVFTPFHRAAQDLPVAPPAAAPQPVAPLDPQGLAALERLAADGVLLPLSGLGLLDAPVDWWSDTVAQHWTPGEDAALEQLSRVDEWLPDYRQTRDLPADPDSTSRLSPHLRAGELSPRQAIAAARDSGAPAEDQQAWIRQLYWREFCWHLTHHLPDVATQPMQERFVGFPYEPDPALAAAWRRGRTGIELVDAGMRQLWQTGWMHNRVRMVTASLFSKNLLQPWQDGEQWFWDTLVDADEANNPVSWQWVAGSGADAAPYFRVFNPERQADRFDPDGSYRQRWLTGAPGRPAEPVVELSLSRRAALAAYEQARIDTQPPAGSASGARMADSTRT